MVGASIGMPDLHSGYGFAIGNVAASALSDPEAVVSPGGVGYDINCGVRLLRTNLKEKVGCRGGRGWGRAGGRRTCECSGRQLALFRATSRCALTATTRSAASPTFAALLMWGGADQYVVLCSTYRTQAR